MKLVLIRSCNLQAIEDKTFGLKNKSKSAKVQGYVYSPSCCQLMLLHCACLLNDSHAG